MFAVRKFKLAASRRRIKSAIGSIGPAASVADSNPTMVMLMSATTARAPALPPDQCYVAVRLFDRRRARNGGPERAPPWNIFQIMKLSIGFGGATREFCRTLFAFGVVRPVPVHLSHPMDALGSRNQLAVACPGRHDLRNASAKRRLAKCRFQQ